MHMVIYTFNCLDQLSRRTSQLRVWLLPTLCLLLILIQGFFIKMVTNRTTRCQTQNRNHYRVRDKKKERPKPIQLTAQQIADEILEKGEIGKPFITSANLTINESIVTMVFTSSYAIQQLHMSPAFCRLVVNKINMCSISNYSSVSSWCIHWLYRFL